MSPRDPERRRSALLVRVGRIGIGVAALAILFLCRGLLVAWFTGGQIGGGTPGAAGGRPAVAGTGPAAVPAPAGDIAYYTCSMHPAIRSGRPASARSAA